MKSSMVADKESIFKSVCEPAYACYQGKGNKHQYLFLLKTLRQIKFRSDYTKLSVILMFISNCGIDAS